jgi:hypothetical protein
VSAALEVVLGEAGFTQYRTHSPQVPGFGVVGSTGDRNLLATDPESIRRPREHERQRLKGLGRRTQMNIASGIA